MKRYLYVETDPAGTSCNLWYPPEIQHKFKSREVSFAHNLLLNYPIVLKFCAEHDSLTVVRCAKYQNDWPNETNVVDEPAGTNEISWDLSLRWISDGYPIFANVDYFELKWNKWKHPIKYLHIIYSVQSEYIVSLLRYIWYSRIIDDWIQKAQRSGIFRAWWALSNPASQRRDSLTLRPWSFSAFKYQKAHEIIHFSHFT